MGLFDKLKGINEMRKEAKALQGQMAQVLISGASFGGKVKLAMDGNFEVKSVEVSPEIAGDKSEVARHVRGALEDLFKNYKKQMQKRFGNMMQ
ncbi:MAG: YbaB/EbfC family nucleoid-associated protein [Candidatus Doudnabacteria bacterium]|nr:YbaB/EbfC family nucleoid-associated protein [Candidatus Doudnabacteria bacterium]